MKTPNPQTAARSLERAPTAIIIMSASETGADSNCVVAPDADNNYVVADDDHYEAMASLPDISTLDTDNAAVLMDQVKAANAIRDESQRDMALLNVLRSCRKELEFAETESGMTAERLTIAKELFDYATKSLVVPHQAEALRELKSIATPKSAKKRVAPHIRNFWKRPKTGDESVDGEMEERELTAKDIEKLIAHVPTNPIHLPPFHTEGGGMTSELLAQHRDNFFRQLIGVPASEVESYTPSVKNSNLKSKAQLAESIHIVRNWSTGADGMDASEFRAKHKPWYSRLKPSTENLGRRTGIHLRELEPAEGQEDGGTVLCRYSKDGSNSIVYLDIEKVFDALFEIHAVEFDHRGRDAVKSRLDERYANIPDGQVKFFIDTCPICCSRRGKALPEGTEEV